MRYVLGVPVWWLVASALVGCAKSSPTVRLLVSVEAQVGALDELRAQAMIPGGEVSQAFHVDLSGRDLAQEPYLLPLKPGSQRFATVAWLSVQGLRGGIPVATWNGSEDLTNTVELPVVLAAIPRTPVDCDADHDGFKACAAEASCCAEGEQGFADCDDSSAVFKPFAEDQACRDCQHLQECWAAQVEAEPLEPVPEVVTGDEAHGEPTAETATDAAVEDLPEYVDLPGSLCSPCMEDEDCGGGGDMCTPLPEGDYCTTLCQDNNDCPSGFLCLQVTNQSKQCVPGLYNKCAECLVDQCPGGQYCDQLAAQCKAKVIQCGECAKDDECGLGSRCVRLSSGDNACIPQCGEGGACPSKSSCQALTGQQGTNGVMACVPSGDQCCFGDACPTCDCAAGNPLLPHCDPLGNCVECTTDAHCQPGKTCQDYQCQSMQCSDPAKPILWNGQCVQCTNDTHCSSKPLVPTCDLGSHVCVEGVTECACVPPYPACVVVNDQVVCVQCDSDDDCDGGCTCDTDQYICAGADGGGFCDQGGCASAGQACAVNGCPADSYGNQLLCDAPSGCCFGASGACDNVTSFCVEPGSECKDLYSILGSISLPGEPMSPSGNCTCTADVTCVLTPGPECVLCPQGLMCLSVAQMRAILGGMGTPADPELGFCVDTSILGRGFR
jgi:hypothetical protein